MTITVTLPNGSRFSMPHVTTLKDLRQRLQAMGINRIKGV